MHEVACPISLLASLHALSSVHEGRRLRVSRHAPKPDIAQIKRSHHFGRCSNTRSSHRELRLPALFVHGFRRR